MFLTTDRSKKIWYLLFAIRGRHNYAISLSRHFETKNYESRQFIVPIAKWSEFN